MGHVCLELLCPHIYHSILEILIISYIFFFIKTLGICSKLDLLWDGWTTMSEKIPLNLNVLSDLYEEVVILAVL